MRPWLFTDFKARLYNEFAGHERHVTQGLDRCADDDNKFGEAAHLEPPVDVNIAPSRPNSFVRLACTR
ncbi:hypothetical protein XH83_35625 (plasmid) [Bradyrhizobium sp. CCBAU 53351]|uniref:Uncharacterized protein n=2 Tax=Bradyrhizobium TaxID=374 RepID=A0AAE5X8B5_9BRAD|nr:hypothetical protein X265_35725 [Bradyrhizobium guangdongense]QAU50623.1 hypothetical protein XH91_34935 [Bradyrhizobium guangzhouense]QOZ49786.1 hypothetical protein XH89_41325 [Bradyrhizobium sp. CCBAU 53340]QOZ56907.1 hypothetical protein XH90_37115 [Bradyrhizobium sp. CCBAU 53338]QOZ80861.1 hypothetical protein XH83_35625 [Bradyrhizobium sp. CCBAU 53351]